MKKRQSVSSTRGNIGRERNTRHEQAVGPQGSEVDEITLQTQRKSTTYSRARGQA